MMMVPETVTVGRVPMLQSSEENPVAFIVNTLICAEKPLCRDMAMGSASVPKNDSRTGG